MNPGLPDFWRTFYPLDQWLYFIQRISGNMYSLYLCSFVASFEWYVSGIDCILQRKWVLYNCGMFFILSFFVGYILSFGLVRLRTVQLSVRVGTHIERRCSRSHGEDVTITDIIIKTPDSIWDWGYEWRHARKRWAEDFGWYLKKSSVLRSEARRSDLILRTWTRPVHLGLWDSPRVVGSDGTVSNVKILTLSLSLSLSLSLLVLTT